MRRRISAAMAALVLATLLVVAGTASPAAACRPVRGSSACAGVGVYHHSHPWIWWVLFDEVHHHHGTGAWFR